MDSRKPLDNPTPNPFSPDSQSPIRLLLQNFLHAVHSRSHVAASSPVFCRICTQSRRHSATRPSPSCGFFSSFLHHAATTLHMGPFWGTRVLEIVKKHDSGGLLWKRIKLTSTRKANAKKRLLRVWQNEAVLKACSEPSPSISSSASANKALDNVTKSS